MCILYIYFSVTVDVTDDRLVRLGMDAGSYAEGLVLVAKYYGLNLRQELAIKNNLYSLWKKKDNKVKLDAIGPLFREVNNSQMRPTI